MARRSVFEFYKNSSGNIVLGFIVSAVLAEILEMLIIHFSDNIFLAIIAGLTTLVLMLWITVFRK